MRIDNDEPNRPVCVNALVRRRCADNDVLGWEGIQSHTTVRIRFAGRGENAHLCYLHLGRCSIRQCANGGSKEIGRNEGPGTTTDKHFFEIRRQLVGSRPIDHQLERAIPEGWRSTVENDVYSCVAEQTGSRNQSQWWPSRGYG